MDQQRAPEYWVNCSSIPVITCTLFFTALSSMPSRCKLTKTLIYHREVFLWKCGWLVFPYAHESVKVTRHLFDMFFFVRFLAELEVLRDQWCWRGIIALFSVVICLASCQHLMLKYTRLRPLKRWNIQSWKLLMENSTVDVWPQTLQNVEEEISAYSNRLNSVRQ